MLGRKEAKTSCSYLINGVTLLTFSHFQLKKPKRRKTRHRYILCQHTYYVRKELEAILKNIGKRYISNSKVEV